MSRDFYIAGEGMVYVGGGVHLSGTTPAWLPDDDDDNIVAELGLAVDSVRVSPRLTYREVYTNDMGDAVAANVLTNCHSADIAMTLVHYDVGVLETCWAEAVGSRPALFGFPLGSTEMLQASCGTPLGNGRALYTSGNRLLTVELSAPQQNGIWRFPACYLVSEPFAYPIGTKASRVDLVWRSIPYAPFVSGEVRSSGVQLWEWRDGEFEDEE